MNQSEETNVLRKKLENIKGNDLQKMTTIPKIEAQKTKGRDNEEKE